MPFFPLNPTVEYNGLRVSRTSCRLVWDTLHIAGWKSLNHKTSVAPGVTYGSRAKPQGRTRGKVTFTVDVEVYEEDFQQLKAYLATKGALALQGWMEVACAVHLGIFEPTRGMVQVVMMGARVNDVEQAISDSDDQLVRKLTLSVMDILDDGITAVFENAAPGF